MFSRNVELMLGAPLSLLLIACESAGLEPTPPLAADAAIEATVSEAEAEAEAEAAVAVETGAEAALEAAAEAAVGMKLGEVREVPAGSDGAFEVNVPGGGAAESYLAIVYSASWETNTEHSYELQPAPRQGAKPYRRQQTPSDRLLAQARAPRRFTSLSRPALPLPSPGTPPKEGDHRTFKVMDSTWTKALSIDGECVKVGTSLAIWLDRTTTDPQLATIDATKLEDIVAGYEGTILPRERKLFGQESDVDQDGLIHVLYTPLFANTGVVAYFSPCDLAKLLGCPVHNNSELIYATPPDLIGSPMMSSVSSILETLAHETHHAIYFQHKYLLNSQETASENPYIGEALGGLAEDLSGYGNGTFYVWAAALSAMEDSSGPDLLDSSLTDYDTGRDGSLRGAGYLLYRYLYEQAGSNEFAKGNTLTDKGGIAWLNALVDSPELGTENVELRSGRPIADILFDWYTALAVSNRLGPAKEPLNTDPRYNYLPVTWDPDTLSSSGKQERHGVDLFAENPMNPSSPLTGPNVAEASEADGTIRAGGVEYLRFASNEKGALQFRLKGSEGSNLRLRVVREK